MKSESPAVPPGTTEISLRGNVAYETYNREKDQADDHQYEKLDEYKGDNILCRYIHNMCNRILQLLCSYYYFCIRIL